MLQILTAAIAAPDVCMTNGDELSFLNLILWGFMNKICYTFEIENPDKIEVYTDYYLIFLW